MNADLERQVVARNLDLENLNKVLREQARQLKEKSIILDLLGEAIFLRDIDDRILYWNDAAQRLYGYTEEEALDRVTHVLLRTEFPIPLEQIQANLVVENAWRGELIHTCRDGSRLTVESSWTLRRDAKGKPASVIEISNNITDRKIAEQDLEKSRARFKAIFQHTPGAVAVFEAIREKTGLLADLRFDMVNPLAENIMNSTASDLVGHTLREKFPFLWSEELLAEFGDTIDRNIDLRTEHLSEFGGTPRWFRLAAVKLDEGLILNFVEITNEKAAELKRQMLAKRFGHAIELLDGGVWEWNIGTGSIDWDARTFELYDLPKDLPISYPVWAAVVVPEDLPQAEARIQRIISEKSQGTIDFRIRISDQSIRYIRSSFGVVLDPEGRVFQAVGVNFDMTVDRKMENRFRAVVEASPNAMIVVNTGGSITLVNSQTEKLFGYSRDELLGNSVEMLLPARFRAPHPGHRAAFLIAPEPAMGANRELFGLCKDGREVSVEIRLTPIESAEGPLVLGSITDVSERSKINQRSQLLAALIEGANEYGIFMVNPDGVILTWNTGASRLTGYLENEIVGQRFSCFYTLEAREDGVPARELEESLASGRFEQEALRVRRDGSTFWASVLITPLFDSEGKLQGFSKLTRDVTDRQRVEQRFRAVVEACPNALIMVSAAGDITLVNRGTETLFGYPRSELLGRNMEMLVPERFRGGHPGHRRNYFSAPAERAMGAGRDLFGVRKDGSEVPIEIGLSPIDTADGLFALASVVNITERKRFEHELQSKAAEMERFAYTVSHDLKSPLITIKSYISMISQDLDDGNVDRPKSDIKRVSNAAGKMQVLLDDVLVVSRVGRTGNEASTTSFAFLVQEALELVGGALKAGSIRVNVAQGLPEVTADCSRIVEVLQNLIENAIKFMGDQQAPEISIGAVRGEKEISFFVRDNGIGLDSKYLETVFGLFHKLNPKSEGSGAGLAIAKRIIESHGGRMWAESEGAAHGSTFRFTLPGTPLVKGRSQ